MRNFRLIRILSIYKIGKVAGHAPIQASQWKVVIKNENISQINENITVFNAKRESEIKLLREERLT